MPLLPLALLVLLVSLLFPSAASAAPQEQTPAGQIGIRLVDAPTDRRDDPRARIYVVDHLEQGDVIRRRVEISNTTPAAASISVYPAAASVADGSFTFAEGRAGNDLTSWTRVTPDVVRVPAGGTATAEVVVDVPLDAVDGERYAVIWAELAGTGPGITTTSRVGIRMYVSVGEGPEPSSDFVVDTLTAGRNSDGSPVVLAEVENTGQRALDMSGTLSLTEGPGGTSAGPFAATVGTTLGVGDRSPVEVVLAPELPAGPWLATLTLRSGTLERQATATITFPDEAGTSAAPVPAKNLPLREDPSVVIPVAAGLLGLALLLLLLLWRRRPKEEEDEPERDERLLEPAG